MIPNKKFTNLSKDFWANIRSISQQTGYTIRGGSQIKIPTLAEIKMLYQI